MTLPAPLSSLFSKVQATTSSEDNLEKVVQTQLLLMGHKPRH